MLGSSYNGPDEYPLTQGCSLGLDVSRPVSEMSRFRLVNFVETSRLGNKIKSLGLVSDMKVSFTVNFMLSF